MDKIEHIGIAVADLEQSIPIFTSLLNTPCYKREKVESEQVETAFFQNGPNKIELLASLTPDGVIARFIQKNGPGMHHIAFSVSDIKAEMKRLKEAGFRLLNEEPRKGADNKWVCFVHPKDASGVLLELCQERNDLA